MKHIHPDEYLTSVLVIDLDGLYRSGVRNFIIDLDNTLLPRGTYEIPPEIRDWIGRARAKGFSIGITTNNCRSTTPLICRDLGLPYVWKAFKPLPFAFWHALHKFGFKRKQSICIGDQLFTDVFGAHFVRMPVILVQPLVEYDLKHTLLLRKLEKPIMKGLVPTR